MLKDKVVFLSGGTGSFGKNLLSIVSKIIQILRN